MSTPFWERLPRPPRHYRRTFASEASAKGQWACDTGIITKAEWLQLLNLEFAIIGSNASRK